MLAISYYHAMLSIGQEGYEEEDLPKGHYNLRKRQKVDPPPDRGEHWSEFSAEQKGEIIQHAVYEERKHHGGSEEWLLAAYNASQPLIAIEECKGKPATDHLEACFRQDPRASAVRAKPSQSYHHDAGNPVGSFAIGETLLLVYNPNDCTIPATAVPLVPYKAVKDDGTGADGGTLFMPMNCSCGQPVPLMTPPRESPVLASPGIVSAGLSVQEPSTVHAGGGKVISSLMRPFRMEKEPFQIGVWIAFAAAVIKVKLSASRFRLMHMDRSWQTPVDSLPRRENKEVYHRTTHRSPITDRPTMHRIPITDHLPPSTTIHRRSGIGDDR
jgi:hypothetical protein